MTKSMRSPVNCLIATLFMKNNMLSPSLIILRGKFPKRWQSWNLKKTLFLWFTSPISPEKWSHLNSLKSTTITARLARTLDNPARTATSFPVGESRLLSQFITLFVVRFIFKPTAFTFFFIYSSNFNFEYTENRINYHRKVFGVVFRPKNVFEVPVEYFCQCGTFFVPMPFS